MKTIAFLIFVILNVPTTNGARILGIALTPSFSHQVAFRPLWRELSLRGHQLVVITTDPMNDPSLTNLTEIDLHFSYELWNKDVVPVMNNPKQAEQMMEVMTVTMKKIVNQQLSYTEVQKLVGNKSEYFDLLIAEIGAPITVIFSEIFKCPYIGMMSLDVPTIVYNVVGNPVNPIANPDVNLPYSGKLSLYERFSSVVHNLVMGYVITDYFKFMDENVKSHFGEGFPTILYVMSKMSLLYVNTNPIVNQIRPLMPNVIQIGGRTLRHFSKPLPQDLQQHLDDATQGAIYFSLGSNVKSMYLPDDTKAILLETFSELPYKVLWKFELDDLPGKSDNVIISKWFPQQDIFKHPNVKLFITQGGTQSIDEAIYDHIPILGLPFLMDQLTNVKRIVDKGLGLSLDYKTLDKKIFKEAILEIINNPKYRNRVKALADLATDQPMTGLEKAVWWAEYVIRHKGAKHLRSPVLEIPSYQYYLLDVIGFCLGAIVVAVYLLVLFFSMKIIGFFFLAVFTASTINGARILGVIPTPSFSHQVPFRPLWKELSLRGHQLLVLTTDPMNESLLTNLTEIDLHSSYEIWNKDMIPAMNNPKDVKSMFDIMVNAQIEVGEQLLNHPEVQKLSKSENEHFDLVLAELCVPPAIAFSEKFRCPYIAVTATEPLPYFYNLVGNLVNPIVNPDNNLPLIRKLSFFERFYSVKHNIFMKYFLMDYFIETSDSTVKKHFGADYPSLWHIFNQMSLYFVETNPTLNPIRTLMPNVIEIGGAKHCHFSKSLPKNLQHLDNATQGFIYFSLGSNVKSKYLSDSLKAVLLESFAELPYKILWKFELEDLPGKPNNVIISKWFPQQDIFKHPNIKLFITQGGIQSINDAIYSNIPMLGLPFFMDQPTNVKRMVAKGLGLSLDYKTLDKKTFKKTIQELINNPKYRNRSKELVDLANDQPMTGLEQAVWWSEYVIRHNGAKHLRSSLFDIHSCQHYLLDIVGFCLVNGARILGVVLTPSFSHQVMFRPLWKELSLRGHELVVLTTDPMNDPLLTNLTEIDLHASYDIWNRDMDLLMSNPKDSPEMMSKMAMTMMKIIEHQLNHPEVKKLINSKTEHFDLLMLEIIQPIGAAFAEKFNCPLIALISFEAPTFGYNMFGNPVNPIANPDINLPYIGKLNFIERFHSVVFNLIMERVLMNHQKNVDRVIKKHFGKDFSNFMDIIDKTSLVFVNTNPVLNQIRPLMPNIIQIGGGIHLQSAKSLSKDLQQHLDDATQGFIFFSLGSNVKSKALSDNLKAVLLETFAELPYKVLWKFELEDLPGKPDNVIISKWFPQQDIFKHPNIKLFITQGGIQSIDEAIYHHIPMLGLPFFMDQLTNIKRVVAKGLGLSLDYKTLDKSTLKETIQEIINNP
ncbi:hypothetical protein ILUMI_12615, partial [Ignelater luminosus]